MAANDDVLIVGKLDSKELEKSINDLIDFVGDKTTIMAGKFDSAMDKMKSAMKDFAITQKVSVDLMKEAWKDMSASFDAMVAAQSGATGGGKGKEPREYAPNTIGALEQEIEKRQQNRKEMELDSDALSQENKLIEERNKKLAEQKGLNTMAAQAKKAGEEIRVAFSHPANSLEQAEAKLAKLKALAANWKGKGVLDETQWNKIQNAIDRTEKSIEKFKMSAMTLKDLKLLPEKSVDDITKKLQALKHIQIDPKNATQVKKLGDEYQRLSRMQNELLGRSIQLTKSNNYLAQSFGYIRNRIVYALTLGAATSFVKQVYDIRAQYELLERSLGVLVNSFERGSQVFRELNSMAIESPFTLMELAGAAKQLTAYNFEANEVVDTTRRLADISSALGVPMERLVYNLGQIRAQTVLNARDARDFANAGLPIVKTLADYYTELEGRVVSTGEVYERMSKKMVSYTDVMSVLNKMTDEGGKFFEFQAKQAQTLRVQMANLTLAWNNMLNEIGEGNQGLLSVPIQVLKSLFQGWKSISRVIENLVLSLGIVKAIQMVAIRQQWAWAAAAGATAKQMGWIANGFKAIGSSIANLAANPWTWVIVGITALTDLIGKMRAIRAETIALNDEIVKTSIEASDANLEFLNNSGNQNARTLAKQGKLTAEEAEKAWKNIEEQLKTSSDAAGTFLTKLNAIDDVNKRVEQGFNYVERIQQAQAALQDLNDTQIRVTQDKGWFGIFGEGLVSDLKDLHEELQGIGKDLDLFDEQGRVNADLGARWKEYRDELEETAKSITNFIRENNIKDPLQIQEILGRVKAIIKTRNPEIKGELEQLFDVTLDKRVSNLTNGAIDENISLWKLFMERLKHNSSAVFQDITTDIYKETSKLSDKQQQAVDENLDYFKKTMPFYYESVREMVEDASKLKIQIGLTFNVQSQTDFQKQVKERIDNASKTLDFGNKTMWGTQNDDLESWVKTQQKAIKDLGAQRKLYEKDNTDWARKQIEDIDIEVKQRKNLLDLFHQQYAEDKKSGRNKKTEDLVSEALKQELQLIKEMRSNYDKLRKAGVSDTEAITLASKGYEDTIVRINNVLQKYGINKFNASNFAGKDVRGLLESLEKQRSALLASGTVKTSSLKDLDVEIQKLTVDAKSYDMDKVTKGLNNELDKLKNEYELAVEFDANPELGGVFADMIGIDKETLSQLPKDFNGVVERLQQIVDDKLGNGKFSVLGNLNKSALDSWLQQNQVKIDSDKGKALVAITEYANKIRKDETEKQVKEWDKLLEKYAEYETKVNKIQNDAVKERVTFAQKFGSGDDKSMALNLQTQILAATDPQEKQKLIQQLQELVKSIAGDDKAKLNIVTSIDERGRQELAKLSFEEFQKSPEWIVATGDLANMSKSAIGLLIDQLEKYKRSAKNLSPKQIKQLNSALSKLYKEQRKNNPFKAISNMLDEAKERMATFDEDIKKTQEEIDNLTKKKKENIVEGIADEETDNNLKKAIKRLQELKKNQEEVGKPSASDWVASINETVSAVGAAVGVFDDLAKAIGGVNTSDVDKMFSILEKGGQGAAAGAQIGGGYGAIIGAVTGLATGIIATYADQLSGNAALSRGIRQSEIAVQRLENAYLKLQDAIENAYGTAAIFAKKVAITNKELQLAELQRQLQLEQARKSKNKDEAKIEELRGQITSLEIEIKNAVNDITNDFLGISSIGDAMNSMMDGFIDALRNGEDAMAVFNTSVDDMIVNMIKQMFTAKILAPMIEKIWNQINDDIQKRGSMYIDSYTQWMQNIADAEAGRHYTKYLVPIMNDDGTASDWLETSFEEWKAWALSVAEKNREMAEQATTPTTEDIRKYAELLRGVEPEMEEQLDYLYDILNQFGLINSTSDKQLSALQQGIEGITEDTAGALEAYMNGVSQQVYLHSEILAQIRDAVVSFDLDVQVATMSQMLLQLQQSYQVQLAIQNILNGWSNPSGMAVRVEMV